jgi:hypothetical protein
VRDQAAKLVYRRVSRRAAHWEMQSWLARWIGGDPIEKPVFESEGS